MTEGRRGVGTVNSWMHVPDVIVEQVADWRPFSYITLRYDVAGVDNWSWTQSTGPDRERDPSHDTYFGSRR